MWIGQNEESVNGCALVGVGVEAPAHFDHVRYLQAVRDFVTHHVCRAPLWKLISNLKDRAIDVIALLWYV